MSVPPYERLEFWREMARRHFIALHIEPLGDRPFGAVVNLRSIGELDAVRVRAHPMLATRTPKHIAHSANDEYFVAVHLRGVAHAEQDERRTTLRPGDLALFDSARPYRISFRGAGAFEHLILRIPHDQLDGRVPHLHRATALTVKAGSDAGRLVVPAVTSLATLSLASPFIDPVLDLIASALGRAAGICAPPTSRRARTLEQIKRYTLAHIGDELTPARVAAACYVSPRQLHRLFEDDKTTFGTFLKHARLSRIRQDLANPERARSTIAEIGHHHGYRDPAVLTRAFTARYGVGPRAYRRSQAPAQRVAEPPQT